MVMLGTGGGVVGDILGSSAILASVVRRCFVANRKLVVGFGDLDAFRVILIEQANVLEEVA